MNYPRLGASKFNDLIESRVGLGGGHVLPQTDATAGLRNPIGGTHPSSGRILGHQALHRTSRGRGLASRGRGHETTDFIEGAGPGRK